MAQSGGLTAARWCPAAASEVHQPAPPPPSRSPRSGHGEAGPGSGVRVSRRLLVGHDGTGACRGALNPILRIDWGGDERVWIDLSGDQEGLCVFCMFEARSRGLVGGEQGLDDSSQRISPRTTGVV